jgi:hypothetical protein
MRYFLLLSAATFCFEHSHTGIHTRLHLLSTQVEHADQTIERMIHGQKWPVIQDMVHMLGICPERLVVCVHLP